MNYKGYRKDIKLSESGHQDPYNKKDKKMVENILKMDLSVDEKSSLKKVLEHITEELDSGI